MKNPFKKYSPGVTIVTALINLGREEIKGGFERSYDDYLAKLEQILGMPNNLVLFVDKEARALVEEKRTHKNTLIINFDKEDLKSIFNHYDETNKIRKDKKWQDQAPWLKDSPQCKLAEYNPLVFSKLKFMIDAIDRNHFNSSHFYWLDGGIASTVHPGYFWHDKVLNQKQLLKNDLLFIAYPYNTVGEVHGFTLEGYLERVNKTPKYVLRGGFFGGHLKWLKKYWKHYQETVKSTLKSGLMGTEESIFTLIDLENKFPIQKYFIEENGLTSLFFEHLKNDTLNQITNYQPPETTEEEINYFSKEEIETWHRESKVHFQRTLDLVDSRFNKNLAINYLDIGCNTGAFYSELTKRLKISKAILIEPRKDVFEFAANNTRQENTTILNVAIGEKDNMGHVHIDYNNRSNLGSSSVNSFPNESSTEVSQMGLNDILSHAKESKIDFIKIHTPAHQDHILKGIYKDLKEGDNRPIILFDYGYYESKDILSSILEEYYEIGYDRVDLYSSWGSDFLLYPKNHPLIVNHGKEKSKPKIDSESQSNFDLSTYFISYNLPKQFELLLESFRKSGNYLLEKSNLILINNSDDPSTDQAYKELCLAHGIKEIKNGNLGICGGRQFAADHFHASDSKYMLFFEDDMLLHLPKHGICRNGFPTWIPDLFESSIKILEEEGLDFLKLSFSEFFGDNKDQWAWHNVPEDVRSLYFPNHPLTQSTQQDSPKPPTHFERIGTQNGLSYLIGDIYYCNWPHLIGKAGNKKMFIDTKWEHPYEQTWMSHFFQMLKKEELKAGLLMASPINHDRVYHYSAEQRKENNAELMKGLSTFSAPNP